MSTASYLQRYLFKWKYVILIIVIISAIAVTVSFQINRWLPEYALSYSRLIGQQFHTNITYKGLNYRFPNCIVFKNVKVVGADGESTMLHASKVTMGFTLPFFTSATPLRYMVIKGMFIDFTVLKDYLRHNKKIRTWAKNIPQANISLQVPDGQIYLSAHTKGDPINFKMVLNFDQGRLKARGLWLWGHKNRFNYEIDGNVLEHGFDLDKFTFENSQSSANLWGSWRDNDIDWKGFIFWGKLYILDIDGHLQMAPRDIILKQLSFSIDGDGVGARGQCSRQNLFQCDADITYLRGVGHLDSRRPLKNIDLHLQARNTPQGLFYHGSSELNFIDRPSSPSSLQSIRLDFDNLRALVINGNTLKLKVKQLQGTLLIHNKSYGFPFENFLASINFEKPYHKIITLSAQLLEGRCYSRIFLDTSSIPWQIKSQGSFEGVKVYQGLLSGSFNLQSSKYLQLSSNLTLENGNFNNTRFQSWASKTLQMPSLANVSDADISCRFKIDGPTKTLEDLKLKTHDIDLNGFFHVDGDNLVSSQGSIRFSKYLLDESTIGRHIIGLVHGAWTMPFEFRLSGNMYRMNFEWDESPLKDKVRQHLFSFFERMIDQRIDAHPYYNATIPSESVSPG